MSVANQLRVVLAVPLNLARVAAKSVHLHGVGIATHFPLSSFARNCAPVTNIPSVATSAQWAEFAKQVSGEWDGFGADFTSEGKPIHLPESVVPDAFREWEVDVFDWQTQCPTLAVPDSFRFTYQTIKLLPTVGCEADAATRHAVLPRDPTADALAFAYHSSGSYVAVWAIPGSPRYLEIEHCLVNPTDRESRIRVIQAIDTSLMKLTRISMFSELWYGPFRNGDQLGGCAIGNSAFASTPPLDASSVTGVWHGHCSSASYSSSQQNVHKELAQGRDCESVRDGRNLILLPCSVWCSVSREPAGESMCEVGWLYNTNSSVTASCIFTAYDKLKEISLAREFINL